MNLEQQIKKAIALCEKNNLPDAAEFIKGFIRKQEVILKKKLKEAKRA